MELVRRFGQLISDLNVRSALSGSKGSLLAALNLLLTQSIYCVEATGGLGEVVLTFHKEWIIGAISCS